MATQRKAPASRKKPARPGVQVQPISPCLWFDDQAEDAARFYVSVFKKSRIIQVNRYPAVGQEIHGRRAGSVMTVDFTLNGLRFTALNGGPQFKFNEAVSFVIHCDTQEEVDKYWNALTRDGGEESMCGWLKDKFGVSWQVTPNYLIEKMQDKDPKKSQAVMKAMLQMRKIDIATIKRAYESA